MIAATLLLIVGIVAVLETRRRLSDPTTLRRLAAWSLARALFLENLRAEETRLRAEAEAFERRRLIEFGVLEAGDGEKAACTRVTGRQAKGDLLPAGGGAD